MNIFLYDSKLNHKAFEKTLAHIEIRITDLGLSGKIIRLGPTQSAAEIIDNEIKKGATTIIVVGSNLLYCRALNALARLDALNLGNKKTPLAYIPVGEKNNFLISLLDLATAERACDVLSARRIEKFSLGRVNNYYFLAQAAIDTDRTKLEIDESYTIEFSEPGEVKIINAPSMETDKNNNLKIKIITKKLHKLILSGRKENKESQICFSSLRILNQYKQIILDGSLLVALPADISTAKEKINLIVGKNRLL